MINGIGSNKKSNSFNFAKFPSNITMIWNKTINNMDRMFYQCRAIISIDLSKFNSSSVSSMNEAF